MRVPLVAQRGILPEATGSKRRGSTRTPRKHTDAEQLKMELEPREVERSGGGARDGAAAAAPSVDGECVRGSCGTDRPFDDITNMVMQN